MAYRPIILDIHLPLWILACFSVICLVRICFYICLQCHCIMLSKKKTAAVGGRLIVAMRRRKSTSKAAVSFDNTMDKAVAERFAGSGVYNELWLTFYPLLALTWLVGCCSVVSFSTRRSVILSHWQTQLRLRWRYLQQRPPTELY